MYLYTTSHKLTHLKAYDTYEKVARLYKNKDYTTVEIAQLLKTTPSRIDIAHSSGKYFRGCITLTGRVAMLFSRNGKTVGDVVTTNIGYREARYALYNKDHKLLKSVNPKLGLSAPDLNRRGIKHQFIENYFNSTLKTVDELYVPTKGLLLKEITPFAIPTILTGVVK